MSSQALLAKLAPFTGKRLIDCADEIKAIAKELRYSFNVMDPEYNISSINVDYSRLNVMTDGDGVITSFTIG